MQYHRLRSYDAPPTSPNLAANSVMTYADVVQLAAAHHVVLSPG